MGLRIKTNMTSLVAQKNLTENANIVKKSGERIATGKRINRSMDDAGGLAISEGINTRMVSTERAKRNAGDAISMLQVAEGGMTELSNLLVRMRELTMQAASDTTSTKDRAMLNREYGQLANEIDRISASTEFNGTRLLSAEKRGVDEFNIQIGINTDTGDHIENVAIDMRDIDFSAEAFGISKGSEIGDIDGGEFTAAQAAEKLTSLDAALEKVTGHRATMGAWQSRLDVTIRNHTTGIEGMTEARGRIMDTDYAEESARSTAAKIFSQASISTLAQANQWPEVALSLIR
jgi:flagellin